MEKTFKTARNTLEYLAFQALRGISRSIPPRWVPSIARSIGSLLYRIDLKHRRVAETNIAMAMEKEVDSPEVTRTARQAFQHLAQVAFEFVLLPDDLRCPDSGREMLVLKRPEILKRLKDHGKGVVCVTGHTGNWELLGAYVSSRLVPLHVVSRPFRNPLMNRFIQRRREKFNQSVIKRKGALVKLARTLKQGGIVVFLVDQHAGSSEPKLDLLGHPAHTYTSPGALAVRFQAPMIAGFCFRKGTGFEYEGYLEDPIWPDPDKDPKEEVLRLTRYANESIGRFVRDHPAQWLWMHRRWR